MSLMSGILGTHGHAPEVEVHRTRGGSRALPHQEVDLESQDTWRYQSPAGRWSWCLDHVAMPEPSCAGDGHVATPKSSPAGVTGSVSRGTWRHRSPLLVGGVLYAMGHVAKPELSGIGSGSRAVGARGGTGALSCRMRSLAPWGWSFKSCTQGYPVCRVLTALFGL
jgi:hypothetical protein